jgi:predicted nucleic acid-binding protein
LIYLDTSAVLAELLAEDRRPPEQIWAEPLLSSRLLEHEAWCRLHARELSLTHGDAAREILSRISFVELSPLVLARALDPFPESVRTLDALHLATIDFLRGRRLQVRLATYDRRMIAAARTMAVPLVPLQ